MKIFVDESGTFAARANGSTIGVVGALVVTESQLPILERKYAQLRPLLLKEGREVKGRTLDEADIARVIDVALRSGLLYEAVAIDLMPNHHDDMERHRNEQCVALTRALTDKHHPDIVARMEDLKDRLRRMPLQLYIQNYLSLELIWTTLQHAAIYYSQREPPALGHIEWLFDAKAPDGRTDAEDWCSQVVMPFQQSRSIQDGFLILEDGDYSHFQAKDGLVPDFLVSHFPHLRGKTGLRAPSSLMDMKFTADAYSGLELVDVFTNALRRALTGRLGQRGWEGLSKLMIHRNQPTYINITSPDASARRPSPEMAAVLSRLAKNGRPLLTDEVRLRHGGESMYAEGYEPS